MTSSDDSKRVVVGVCAMAKKAKSKPMRNILSRLEEFNENLEIMIFDENVILNRAVEEWPHCDCLISFQSKGFPLHKAIRYAEIRRPYVLNDLGRQYELLDRTKVYEILKRYAIEAPHYEVLRRKIPVSETDSDPLVETDDQIEVNGVVFHKPFVEKPTSAEDHNICIYYPSSAGGGSQRLFRKIDNLSSVYTSASTVRRDGSYIYEDFMPTDGTDVKVYAVGPDYAHAEARKSPGLDGKVERDAEGKEIRYPVILSSKEKLIARKIVLAFRQTVCGFDLLRSNGKSYVCDVNGFSFVKTSVKYYEDAAKIIGNMIMRRLAPALHIPWQPAFQLDDPPLVNTTYGKIMELRSVVAVIRHGDRTPKQKLKMEVTHKLFMELFTNSNGFKSGEVKLKRPKQLQQVLDIVRQILQEMSAMDPMKPCEITENRAKLEQVKMVLEMYGYFSGVNRKVQLRFQNGRQQRSSDTAYCSQSDSACVAVNGPSLLLIVKWGGELTPAGKIQAEELAKAFRCLYPGGQNKHQTGQSQDSRGLGFLRLHSTYRHDLKIYASDEGRVQMTAAAFAKGLLALEGELTPILAQMVKSANTNGLLDDDRDARKCQNVVKKFLHNYLQQAKDLDKEDFDRLNPLGSRSIQNALSFIGNPRRLCDRIYDMMHRLVDLVKMRKTDPTTKDGSLYLNESWDLAERRWSKLLKDFKRCHREREDVYDISKIPDIYDCVKYDLEHNSKDLMFEQMEELYISSKYMADIVVPQEYGISKQEKLMIGQGTCIPLMTKIKTDLQRCIEGVPEDENLTRLDPRGCHGIATPLRNVRTRLYFTSESHIHSLMNLIRYGELVSNPEDKQWQRAMHFLSSITEFNYMAQLVLMLYEDTTKEPSSPSRFHVELHFSPGALPCIQTTHVPGLGYRPKSRESAEQEKLPKASEKVRCRKSGSRDEEETVDCALQGAASDDDSSTQTVVEMEDIFDTRLAEHLTAPVNIVAIGAGGSPDEKPITNEELARHSPHNSPRSTSPAIVCGAAVSCDRTPTTPCCVCTTTTSTEAQGTTTTNNSQLMKSLSESSCTFPSVAVTTDDPLCGKQCEEQEQQPEDWVPRTNNYNANVKAVCEQTAFNKRTRHAYKTGGMKKHHTTMNLGLLKQTVRDNKLISTAVISGSMSLSSNSNSREEKIVPFAPALMSTAVIARGNSAPDLKILNEESYKQDMAEDESITYFVPPLRSLETLHNQLNYKQVDDFLERITTLRTPVPSPPKTPRSLLSRENSLLSSGSAGSSSAACPSTPSYSSTLSPLLLVPEQNAKDLAKKLSKLV